MVSTTEVAEGVQLNGYHGLQQTRSTCLCSYYRELPLGLRHRGECPFSPALVRAKHFSLAVEYWELAYPFIPPTVFYLFIFSRNLGIVKQI